MKWTTALTVVSAITMAACASRSDSSDASDNDERAGTDAASVESDTEALGTSFVVEGSSSLGLSSGISSSGEGLHLKGLGDGAATFYQPAGCLVATRDDAAKKITYVLNGCSGKLGLLHVTGTIVADYSQSTLTELRVQFSGTQLKVNRATIDWNASANITTNGDNRTMVWNGTIEGMTGNGRSLERINNKTINWVKGSQCITVNGESQGNLSGRELTTIVENYKRCEGECPEAGGKITVSSPNGSLSIVVLDGGRARVTAGTRSAEFRLPCSYL